MPDLPPLPDLSPQNALRAFESAARCGSFVLAGRELGVEDMAARLSLHPRTLRRRLRDEGTTFAALKDKVRFAAARELLMLGPLSPTNFAIMLDCASASSFVHSFRRWGGLSPGGIAGPAPRRRRWLIPALSDLPGAVDEV